MLQQMKEELVSSSEQVTKVANYYHTHKDEIERVAAAFVKIDTQSARVTDGCIDLNVAGNKHVLAACFSAFRKLGYEPSDRPGIEMEPSFACYWEHSQHKCKWWLYFSSTQCTRIKIGTEMREVAIYETVCE